MKQLDKLLYNTFTKKYWQNYESLVCDGKHHAYGCNINYRPYRRGKKRCLTCGAKLGKPKLERCSYRDKLIDNISFANPILAMLKVKGKVTT